MAKPLIAVTDSVFPDLEPAKHVLSRIDAAVCLADSTTPEAILEAARTADGIMVTYAKITAETIGRLERCRVIGRFGIGVDNIDLSAASKSGIRVTFAPDYCLDEVSDHAMALLLTLVRKTAFANAMVQQGRWEMKAVVPIRRFRGSTLGLVGFGRIPQALTPKAQGFGLKVVAYDPFVAADVVESSGVSQVDFDELLATSDYISIHAPLTSQTHHLFDNAAFRRMRSHALLVNTARGPLIDEQALAQALDAGLLGGAALDVVETEPLSRDSALLGRDNVIINPHTAFYSEEALQELQIKVAEDVVRVLTGEAPRYPANRLD